ncbi:MAG: hypothetical protein HY329_15120 [Chloroflexi bacterium]|nr:hypothetical protein [Chloroflexota bacterium]
MPTDESAEGREPATAEIEDEEVVELPDREAMSLIRTYGIWTILPAPPMELPPET